MKTIVAAIDFSDVTQSVVDTAEYMAKAIGGQIVLFHMSPAAEPWVAYAADSRAAGIPVTPTWEKEEEEARKKMLDRIRDTLFDRGTHASVHVIRSIERNAIWREMDELHPDLVVVGSHRHGVLRDLFGQGVCTRIVRRAPCPVLVVHPEDAWGVTKNAPPLSPVATV